MHHARTSVVGAVVVLLSMIALVAACGEDDPTIPPANDAGSSSSGDTGTSSGGDGSSTTDAPIDSGGQDTGPVTPVITAECAAFADAYCDLFQRCYPILLYGLRDDQPTCRARAGLGCSISVQAPGAAVPPQTCSTALKAALCTSNLTNIDPTCQIKGTIANDAPCEYDGQCQSGSCPKKGAAAANPCATCKPRSLVNTSCATTDCEYGLMCSEAGTCVAPAALNNACVKGGCAPPNRCTGTPGNMTCKAPLAADAACTAGTASADHPCNAVNGDYCKVVGGPPQCKPILFVDPNATCGIDNGQALLCKGTAQCKQDKCVPSAADGAACNNTSGPGCIGPAECINGVCTFPKPDRCK